MKAKKAPKLGVSSLQVPKEELGGKFGRVETHGQP